MLSLTCLCVCNWRSCIKSCTVHTLKALTASVRRMAECEGMGRKIRRHTHNWMRKSTAESAPNDCRWWKCLIYLMGCSLCSTVYQSAFVSCMSSASKSSKRREQKCCGMTKHNHAMTNECIENATESLESRSWFTRPISNTSLYFFKIIRLENVSIEIFRRIFHRNFYSRAFENSFTADFTGICFPSIYLWKKKLKST